MPPADNNAPVQPTDPSQVPPEKKKMSFWAKLFGKKEDQTAIVTPQPTSLTPEPRLDDTSSPEQSAPAATESSDITATEGVDPQTGAPQSENPSSPDADGSLTAPSVDVPQSVAAPTASSESETPTVPAQPAQPQQSAQPQPFQQPQQPQAPQQPPFGPQPPTQNQ